MRELQSMINSIQRKRVCKPREYLGAWTESDVLNGKVVRALVIILRTKGCRWALKSGCSMCGYINDAVQDEVKDEDLLYQYECARKKLNRHDIVKIYTSGSFLDIEEIPERVQLEILKDLGKDVQKVIVESRPEFIVKERVEQLKYLVNELEIAIGLESADNFILRNSINKGFTFEDYIEKAELLRDLGVAVKTYILIKPPFLTEKEAIETAVNSTSKISKYSQTISFNPVNIQSNTLVEFLWKRNEYATPWLWSVVEVLQRSKSISDSRLISDPTAGGGKRGAHNCGRCDRQVLKSIREFSLTQDISVFKGLYCECKERWLDLLDLESFAFTQLPR